jgi:hypothetical protein
MWPVMWPVMWAATSSLRHNQAAMSRTHFPPEEKSAPLQVPPGATLEHVFESDHYHGLCCDGERFYGVDGRHIVRFDPGERRPRPLCPVSRDARMKLAAHKNGIVVAEDAQLFCLSPDGVRRDLRTLPRPPDALYAFLRHIVWVTNSDPQNPDGRTYGLQAQRWPQSENSDGKPPLDLLPADPNPPYGVCERDGRYYVLRRRKKRGLFGIERQSVALFQLELADLSENAAPAPVERHDFGTPDMLEVMTATSAIAQASDGEEKKPGLGLWVSADKQLLRIPSDGPIERVELDVAPRRLAQTAHGPVFMVDCDDHLRIEQRTGLGAKRHVLRLPRLPWPAVLIGRGDFLFISVGPALLRTRL